MRQNGLNESMLTISSQGTMGKHLPNKYPPLLLHGQVLHPAHEERRHDHQQLLRQRLHRPSRPPRLYVFPYPLPKPLPPFLHLTIHRHQHERRHRLLHPRSLKPIRRPRHPRQHGLPGTCLDPSHALHNGHTRPRRLQRHADGSPWPA